MADASRIERYAYMAQDRIDKYLMARDNGSGAPRPDPLDYMLVVMHDMFERQEERHKDVMDILGNEGIRVNHIPKWVVAAVGSVTGLTSYLVWVKKMFHNGG